MLICLVSRSLYNTIGIRRFLRPVNLSLQTQGLTVTLRNIVQKCTKKFIVNIPSQTRQALKKDRVLVICNHPSQLDMLLLMASIPSRQNLFFIVMHGLMSILPKINKHFIPIYISHRIDNKSEYDWKYRLLKKLHQVRDYSPVIAHQKNVKSISLAAKKIDDGSLVAMFPTGGTKDTHNFSPGIGYLIKNLKYPQKTKLVMAHVAGTSTWDLLRVIPFMKIILPKLRVDFSEALDISQYIKGEGREISQKLQQVYENWSQSSLSTL
jgi:1-acyl-sn-glycerol-3-phosphate acyltransferase